MENGRDTAFPGAWRGVEGGGVQRGRVAGSGAPELTVGGKRRPRGAGRRVAGRIAGVRGSLQSWVRPQQG